jgi:hypothetical protein
MEIIMKRIRRLSLLILLIVFTFLLFIIITKDKHTSVTLEESVVPTPSITTPAITATPLPSPDITTSNNEINSSLTKEELYLLNANTLIDIPTLGENYLDNTFYSMKIDETVLGRIYGISYKDNPTINYEDLRYIRVLHYDFNEDVRIGELIVHKDISTDMVDIFYELYEARYPIEKMVLIDEYNGDDNTSMADNNTSAFNYREITGSNTLSKHSMGLAIDINPLYNPYVKTKNDTTTILPIEGKEYMDRTLPNEYYINKDDVCYKTFTKRGFTWGGSWNSLKDYQHFEK